MNAIVIVAMFIVSMTLFGSDAIDGELVEGTSTQVVFQSILKGVAHKFYEDSTTIHIDVNRSDMDEVRTRLFESVSSFDGFRYHFAKQLPRDQQLPTEAGESFSSLGVLSKEDAVLLIKRLFGNDIFTSLFFNEQQAFGDTATYNDGVLCSAQVGNERCLKAFKNELLSAFVAKDINDLKTAFHDDNFVLQPQAIKGKKGEGLFGLIHHCFRVIRTENQSHVAIDFRRMFDLCHAPVIDEEKRNNVVHFSIDKKHFILHLKQLFLDRTLLRFVKEDESIFGERVFIKEKLTQPKPVLVAFVIDQSGSLSKKFSDLKKNLVEVAKRIWWDNPQARIRLVFFADGKEIMGTFSSEQQEEFIKRVMEQQANGGTRLLRTLKEEIDELLENDVFRRYHINLVVFTDGHNNVGECDLSSEALHKIVLEKDKLNAYAVGFGHDCDLETLQKIANATCGRWFKVTELDKFKQLLSETVDCNYERKLESILLEIEGQSVIEAFMPVLQDDYGFHFSGVFQNSESFEEGEILRHDEIDEADNSTKARLLVSKGIFTALDMVNNPGYRFEPLRTIGSRLMTSGFGFAAQIIDHLQHVIQRVRSGGITPSQAKTTILGEMNVYKN